MIRRLTIALLLLVCVSVLANSYTTSFPGANENPISEGGNWINGNVTGKSWSDCAIFGHVGYGAQTTENPNGNPFNDSTAVLTGSWGMNQTATGTVLIDRSSTLNNNSLEIELRLNTSITTSNCSGYEIDYSANILPTRTGYIFIVRWPGAFGSFTSVTNGVTGTTNGAALNLHTGDIISATGTYFASTNTMMIQAFINGTNFYTGYDQFPITNGSPGIGFDIAGDHSLKTSLGYTSFTATDGSTTSGTTLQLNAATLQLNGATIQLGQ